MRKSIFKDRIAKLIDVKSIITLSYTFTILMMAILGKKIPDELAENYKYILMIYFGSKTVSDIKRVSQEKE